jgi:hypothetical protein
MTQRQAEEQLILASAGVAARRHAFAAADAARLAGTLDWGRLTAQLRGRRLLATLGPRIVELLGGRAEQRFELALEEALRNGRHQGAFLQMIAARMVGELDDAGIASVPLKGPQLSEALYGDPARRPSSDIDLLVAPEQLRRAVEVVRRIGYRPPTDTVDARGLPLLHFALAHERDELPPIELHWRIHWYEERFACERLLGPTARRGSIDELLALLLFYARDGFVDLRLATDVGAWWDAFGESLADGDFERSVRAYPQLERVLVASARAAHEVVGLPTGWLGDYASHFDRRARIAVRLTNPNPRSSQAQVYADMGLVDGLLIPSKGFWAFLRRQMVPSHARIRESAQGSGWQARSSLMHCIRVVGRYGLALARLLVAAKPVEPR